MLNHTAGKTVEFLNDLFEVLIIVLDLDFRRAPHLSINTGNTQTSLRKLTGLVAFFNNDRIYHRPAEILQI